MKIELHDEIDVLNKTKTIVDVYDKNNPKTIEMYYKILEDSITVKLSEKQNLVFIDNLNNI